MKVLYGFILDNIFPPNMLLYILSFHEANI
jgi:hypothetical protein